MNMKEDLTIRKLQDCIKNIDHKITLMTNIC